MNRLDDETLLRLHDGDLPAEDQARAEELLAEDEAARRKLTNLELTTALVRTHLQASAAEAPLDGLWERVQADLSAAPSLSPWERFRTWLGESMGAHPLGWAGAGAVAVAAAVVLAVVLAGGRSAPSPRPAPPSLASPGGSVIIQDLDAPDRHPDVYQIRSGKHTTTVIWLHDDEDADDARPQDAPPARRDNI